MIYNLLNVLTVAQLDKDEDILEEDDKESGSVGYKNQPQENLDVEEIEEEKEETFEEDKHRKVFILVYCSTISSLIQLATYLYR